MAYTAALTATFGLMLPITTLAQTPDIMSEDTTLKDLGWALVWSDEFNGKSIDKTKWNYDTDCWGGGNEERQCYTDKKKNANVKDGVLSITALRKRTTGHALPLRQRKTRKLAKKSATKPYSSARLQTMGKGDWRYGRIEIRAKLPGGQGVWPAIWMLPSDEHYGTWAASGEIDIMEAVNLGVPCEECQGGFENRILGTLHYGDVWPNNKHSGTDTPLIGQYDDFHTYAIEWSAGKITWFIDGKPFATQTGDDWHSAAKRAEGRPFAPFDQRFHLILNVAIGGRLPEGRNAGGVSKADFPKSMEVDWVRVYECSKDPLNGVGCEG